MNYDELKKDLVKKTEHYYFTVKLFKKDKFAYRRRSFDDLFKYYRRYGVTEKMLAKALEECGFVCRVCDDLKKAVFFRCSHIYTYYLFWVTPSQGYTTTDNIQNSKYTYDYINNLLLT